MKNPCLEPMQIIKWRLSRWMGELYRRANVILAVPNTQKTKQYKTCCRLF